MTHICVGNLAIIGSDNGLSPGWRQVITWTNIGILLIGPLVTNFNEMLIEIHTLSFKKIHLKMSSGKWRPFCPGLNGLMFLVQWILSQNCGFCCLGALAQGPQRYCSPTPHYASRNLQVLMSYYRLVMLDSIKYNYATEIQLWIIVIKMLL